MSQMPEDNKPLSGCFILVVLGGVSMFILYRIIMAVLL